MKLSVSIITYNHEQYISQALDSVLMQEVDFEYEIVIGEDCSSDATRSILESYRQRFPDRIKLLNPGQNQGMIRNFASTISVCRGDFIALLEGDDYWTSPHKLQKQVDYLERHPECVACFHNVHLVHEGSPEMNRLFHMLPPKEHHSLRDVVSSHFIPTCSTVFRNRMFRGFPEWYYQMPMGDWPLHVMNAEHGLYGYLDESLAAYRIHDRGVWSTRPRIEVVSKTIAAADIINKHLGYSFNREISRAICMWEDEIARLLIDDHRILCGLRHSLRAICRSPRSHRFYLNGIKLALVSCVKCMRKRTQGT